MQVTGVYYLHKQSQSVHATLWLCDAGVQLLSDDELIAQFDDYQQGQQITGLPVELTFADGSRFVPHDAQHRWPSESRWDKALEAIERHKLALCVCVLAAALLCWALFFKIIPSTAATVARALPEPIVHAASEQSFEAVKYLYLEPSELSDARKQHIRTLWHNHIKKIENPPSHLQLHFFSAPKIGANAFALPDGQVVLTDELADALKENDTALLAVLLHEIGHVEYQHGLTLAAQSAGASVSLALLFGDLQGFAEIIMGTGSTLLQQQFSRDMERQADDYALRELKRLGYSSKAFAEAMKALAQAHELDPQQDSQWEYLSSHPAISERIERAQQAQE